MGGDQRGAYMCVCTLIDMSVQSQCAERVVVALCCMLQERQTYGMPQQQYFSQDDVARYNQTTVPPKIITSSMVWFPKELTITSCQDVL
eukprot:1945206-Amphidinium_carterae.1